MLDYKNNWYDNNSIREINKLVWFEDTPQPSLDLILSCNLRKDDIILEVGSGTATLIKNLLQESYSNIVVTDISSVSIDRAKKFLDSRDAGKIKWVVDDIADPKIITRLAGIDLWHDRIVLPVLDEYSQNGYLNTLKILVRKNGFVIIAVLSPDVGKRSVSFGTKNYDYKMIEEFLGKDFKLLKHFSYSYRMSSGTLRPYVYTLFQRIT
jgi:EEF1A lysine methyltransferase 2